MKLYLIFLVWSTLLNFISSQSCPFSQSIINGASATYYTAMDAGNCGYEKLTGPLGPGNYMIAALGTKLYQLGGQCGQCFKISNSKNATVTVMATDSCNDAGYCQRDNHFDLSPTAFSILGLQSQGVLDGLSYVKVPCEVTGNVKIMMKDGSNDYWTSFFIFNSKVIIKQVSIKLSNSNQFVPLTQTTYNYWPSSISGGQFQVRIESIGGEFIYVTIPKVESRKVYETTSQFSTSCSSNKFFETTTSYHLNPQTSTPQTSNPQTSTPQTSKPQTSVPQTSNPQSSIPSYCQQYIKQPNYIMAKPSFGNMEQNEDFLQSSSSKLIPNILFITFLIVFLYTY
ncbi:hypothetical protein RB653_002689 [Dictyostelium firmibasis]|uniref:Expansin-like EG45 domain-containing protein n=1 Tax=Dictyostelium firmibasis TaxID=79012 RepID=A0AAN7YQB1_9MYCE